MDKKQKQIIGIVFLALLLVIIFANGLIKIPKNPFAIELSSTFTPIYCNDYSFTSCVDKVISTDSFYLTNEQALVCPPTSSYCKVISATNDFYIGSGNCHYVSVLGSIFSHWTCDSERIYSSGSTVNPGSYLYGRTSVYSSIQYETHKDTLVFSGRAGSGYGVEIAGADKCTFNPSNNYDGKGNLLKFDTSANSYTVPRGDSILTWSKGDRHICGNFEEQCKSNNDCGGHTYGNNECNGRTLQTYGCNQLNPTKPSGLINEDGINLIYNTQNSNSNIGNILTARCELTSNKPVQCCGDTDCGSNAFCDTNPNSNTAFTCQTNVQCRQDSDCGTSPKYDPSTKTINTPLCSSGQCTVSKQAVQCYYNSECPVDSICSLDKKCVKSNPSIKQQCDKECCTNEQNYFDRACPTDKPYCISNSCKTTPPDESSKSGECKWYDISCWIKKSFGGAEECAWYNLICKAKNSIASALEGILKVIIAFFISIIILPISSSLLTRSNLLKRKTALRYLIALFIGIIILFILFATLTTTYFWWAVGAVGIYLITALILGGK